MNIPDQTKHSAQQLRDQASPTQAPQIVTEDLTAPNSPNDPPQIAPDQATSHSERASRDAERCETRGHSPRWSAC